MPYVIDRVRKCGVRYTAMYTDENGRYKSAGTYDTQERAQAVAEQHERHVRLRLAGTSPADKATITIRDFGDKFLREHAVEPNSTMTYAQLLRSHAYPYIGKRRVAETIHRLLTVVLPEEGASQSTIVNVRTCLSAMMQMAWDHGYRDGNPVKGIRLKHPPSGPIVVATVPQFQRVHAALPHQPARVFARLGVSTGARYCELISFIPEDFDFGGCMLTVSKSTVEVTADFHPDGYRFLTQRQKTGRAEREWSAGWRRDPTEYMGKNTWYRTWNTAVGEARLPFRYTPYQIRHTHASWLIDQGVDLGRVRHRLGHGDLTTTTRHVKILDEEDYTAADVMCELLKAVG